MTSQFYLNTRIKKHDDKKGEGEGGGDKILLLQTRHGEKTSEKTNKHFLNGFYELEVRTTRCTGYIRKKHDNMRCGGRW